MPFSSPGGAGWRMVLLYFSMSTLQADSTSPSTAVTVVESPRYSISFNAGWRFHKGGAVAPNEMAALVENESGPGSPGAGGLQFEAPTIPAFAAADFDDNAWRQLDLPHDWGIEGPFHQEYPGETGKLPWWGEGWYRKHFTLPASDAGKQIYLDIDGAMSYSTVYLNGQLVGGWPYGYSSYRLDLTPYLKIGDQTVTENVLAIRLDNPNDSSRWYPGGGIYRNAWLVKTALVHVAHWGTYVTTPQVSTAAATVSIQTTLQNDSAQAANVRLISTVLDADNKAVAEAVESAVALPAGGEQVVSQQVSIVSPQVWSLKTPYLYRVVTRVEQGASTLDSYETLFGVRTIQFDKDQGFLLNGTRVPLNGVCQHHDLGALGAAINVRALERQIEILQEMGCNAIRTSHNPPAPEFLDLCDRMGILVLDEFADTWTQAKKPNGYAKIFAAWSEKDVRAMVRRDRNHPCLILWSTGNEIGEQNHPHLFDVSRRLTAIVHEEDPTRLTTVGVNDTRGGYNGFQKTMDVFGYNYKPWEYKKFREANLDIPLYGSETASTISSRGEYSFPVSEDKGEGRADFQMSSYDLYTPEWATTPDTEFAAQDENSFVAGEFVWTGFDYLGEPTPYNDDSTNLLNYHTPEARAAAEKELQELGKIKVPSRSSYFGILDLAGFKKDRFYLYQARWRPDLKMAHILPHWNWPERVGQVTPIHVYTSGDEAELFLNGRSLGRRKKGRYEYRLRWDDVIYEPGELRVVAYKNGEKWAEETRRTTGHAARVLLKADRNILSADGQDLSFVTVSIADRDGLMVPRSKNHLKFEISGPGEIIATDNGDATDHTSFQSTERNAFNGLALVIVRTQAGKAGSIKIKATSDGLASAEVLLHTAG
jgi:beta-galactosidase